MWIKCQKDDNRLINTDNLVEIKIVENYFNMCDFLKDCNIEFPNYQPKTIWEIVATIKDANYRTIKLGQYRSKNAVFKEFGAMQIHMMNNSSHHIMSDDKGDVDSVD